MTTSQNIVQTAAAADAEGGANEGVDNDKACRWLETLGLVQYAQALAENGFDSLRSISYLTAEHLTQLSIPMGHQALMLAKLPNSDDNDAELTALSRMREDTCRGTGRWDSSKTSHHFQVTEDGRTATRTSAAGWNSCLVGATPMRASANPQHYFEVSLDAAKTEHANHNKGYVMVGVCTAKMVTGSKCSHQVPGAWLCYGSDSYGYSNGKLDNTYLGRKFAAGDTIGMLLNFEQGTMNYFINGHSAGTLYDKWNPDAPCISKEPVLFACVDVYTQHDAVTLFQSE